MTTETKNQEQESKKEGMDLKALMTLSTEDRAKSRETILAATTKANKESDMQLNVEELDEKAKKIEEIFAGMREEEQCVILFILTDYLPFPTQEQFFQSKSKINKKLAVDTALENLIGALKED